MYKDQSFCEASTGVLKSKPVCDNKECSRHNTHTLDADPKSLICWADHSTGCEYYQREYET